MDTAIQKLIEFMENASPAIWAIYVRQVYVGVALDWFWAVFLILSSIALRRGAQACKSQEYNCESIYERDDWRAGRYVLIGFSATAFLIAIALISAGAVRMANPEFYAIGLLRITLGGQ